MGASMILVTGAPGWLGTRLVEAIDAAPAGWSGENAGDASARIRALVLPSQIENARLVFPPGVEIVSGDVRDDASIRRFCDDAAGSTLFHCAGVIHPRGGVQEFTDVNVIGTGRLLGTAVRQGVRRFIAMSSNSPVGCNPRPDHLFDESSPYNAYMGYGRSKQRMEEIVRAAQSRGEIETVIIRSPWFYGPNQPPRQTLFFRLIRDGRFPIVGDGANRRSMAYIDNICQGLMLAASTLRAAGNTYWIADRRPYSMNEIVDTVERLLRDEFNMPVAGKRLRLPPLAGSVARYVDGGLQRIGLYHQKTHVLSELHQTIACTIQKAQRELGFEPRIDLEEGMRRSIRWCVDRGFLEITSGVAEGRR